MLSVIPTAHMSVYALQMAGRIFRASAGGCHDDLDDILQSKDFSAFLAQVGPGIGPLTPLFDAEYYLGLLPRPLRGKVNPVVHFCVNGPVSGHAPHILFDAAFVRGKLGQPYPSYQHAVGVTATADGSAPVASAPGSEDDGRAGRPIAGGKISASLRFSVTDRAEPPMLESTDAAREPSVPTSPAALPPLASAPMTASARHDVVELFVAVLESSRPHISPHPLFDAALWSRCGGTAPATHPVIDFLQAKDFRGRSFSPYFSPALYGLQYPAVRAGRVNPLLHYLRRRSEGAAEDANPMLHGQYYSKTHGISGADPLCHFIVTGAAAGLAPNPFAEAELGISGLSRYSAEIQDLYLDYIRVRD